MKDDKLFVEQIIDSIEKIEKFTKNLSFEDFKENQEKQSAVILQLAIIGELSKKLSDAFKTKVDLPWKEIAGFRDRAVHDYFSLDIQMVYKTIEDDLPMLKAKLKDD